MPQSGSNSGKGAKHVDISDRKDSIKRATQNFFENLWIQIKSLKLETLIYILLALGLILLLVSHWLGGAIIGFVAGYIFSEEIVSRAISVKNAIEHEDVTRGVVLGVVLIAFFILAPAIVIAAAAAIGIKRLVSDYRRRYHG